MSHHTIGNYGVDSHIRLYIATRRNLYLRHGIPMTSIPNSVGPYHRITKHNRAPSKKRRTRFVRKVYELQVWEIYGKSMRFCNHFPYEITVTFPHEIRTKFVHAPIWNPHETRTCTNMKPTRNPHKIRTSTYIEPTRNPYMYPYMEPTRNP